MKEADFVEVAVRELSQLPFVKKVEVVPVCEIFIDACLKVFVKELNQETKRAVADKVIEVASSFERRLGRRPEIYFDVVEE
ncbi:hypothetical protein [Thermovibrio sp.]